MPENRSGSAENDAHVRHADSHGRPWPIGSWYCCGAVQLGVIGPDDCNECGEPWPCSSARPIPPAMSVVQEGIRCSHGVQGPYASAGEPVANCGERGTVVYRLLHPNGEATDWSPIPPGVT